MIDISKKDILDIIFELTHIKDEEGNDVPHFCFTSDLAMDLDAKEEELAVIAAKDGYKIYKVFPGETMLGGLIILADGATLEPVETMYKEFYGEMPDIVKMKLDDEDHLVEVEDEVELEESVEGKSIKQEIEDILNKYEAEDRSKITLFEVDPGTFIEPFDDGDVDFSQFSHKKQNDGESDMYSFTITGGLNGAGDWEVYLDDIKKIFKDFKKELKLEPVLYKVDTDIADDVWNAYIFLYENPTDSQLKESLIKEDLNESLSEAKNKRPKIKKVGDPNAKAMWGRTRHRVELPKKGKGSFKRHPKHRLDEIFITPEQSDVDELLRRIKEAGFIIESTREEGFDEDAKDIHIQVYDDTVFGNPESQTAQEIYNGNKEEIENRFRELANICSNFDDELNNKYHLTYSIGFGGKARDGTDCTGRVSAGIDLRAYWVDPNVVEIGEDLDLDVHDLNEFIFAGEDEFIRGFDEQAKTVGATIEYYDRVCPNREDALWYDHVVADIQFPNEGLGIEVITSGETRFTLDGDTIRYPDELEERGIYTDGQLYEAENEGRIDWDMNSWWDFRVYLLEDDRKGEYGGDMGYDCMSSLSEALDAPGYMDVIADFKENWLEDLTEAKKKNPLKDAARKHKKTDKKGAMGWFIAPNIEQSIQHFNHVSNGSAESTITAPAGLGEDLDLETTDTYEWEYDLATAPKYKAVGYKFDDAEQVYTGEKYWYSRIPETCMKVSRKDYKTNKLLTMPKNANVMKGVDEFFKAHPSAKYCVIGCKDISHGGYGRYVNAWRVLLEENLLTEATDDYWVLSDGKNPRNSNVYASIDDVDEFIATLEASKPQKYWELLHYVGGDPIRVWSTADVKQEALDLDAGDLDLDVIKMPDNPRGVRFEARPREDFMHKRWRYGRTSYPEFIMPSNGKQIFKKYYREGRYMLCKAAETVIDKFFVNNPRNQYCVLLAYDEDGKPLTAGRYTDGLWGNELPLSEAAEKHDTLNPKLWDEANNLKPEVREKILEIVKEFTDGLEEDEIKFKIDDIVLVGSNCSYNYNDKSDLDVHIRMDTDSLECPDDLYPLLYSAYRSLFNNKFDIDFYGIPVEIYVETSETEQMDDEPVMEARKQSALKSNGIYSVMNNEWIKEPVAEDIPEVDQEAFDKEFEKWETRYQDIIGDAAFDVDSAEEIVEAALEKVKFYYAGPLYRFEQIFRRHWEAETMAVSLKKAINNFNAKAKEEFGFPYGARLNIDPDYVEVDESEPEEPQDAGVEHGKCEKCGRELNDAGECPLCDLGDESVLDESVRGDKVEEIEDFIEDIYDLRKTSIANEGEYGIGNLVFKECRNRGYLDNLRELKNALKSKELSLESLEEHLTRYQIEKKVSDITEEKVKSWINDDTGWDMTIDPDTLDKADFSRLPKGWIVTQNFGLDNLFDPTDYAGMTAFIKSILVEYGDRFYIGTYKMKYGKHRGKIAIDVNRIIKNTREAIIDGIVNLQESIYRYDEYLFLTHNLISRRTGKKKPDPLSRDELKAYDLDGCIVDEPIENCMNIELVTGVFPTDIPAAIKKK